MEYYSPLKGEEILTNVQLGEELSGRYAEWNKPVPKRQTLCASTHVLSPLPETESRRGLARGWDGGQLVLSAEGGRCLGR